MSDKTFNILTGGNSLEDYYAELIKLTKDVKCLNQDILDQAKLTNLYLAEISDTNFNINDINK
jgi:hypothetical protein